MKSKDQGMYFFDIENTNKVIKVDLGIGKHRKIQREKQMFKNRELNLKRKYYGEKWYINPKKWNETMNKNKQRQQNKYLSDQKYVVIHGCTLCYQER
mmetsp:Transcript_30955/g.35363  ORF Transcript_30955/g.35363 Transcript_30955/m.35363 type:complete len:97 (+) Transcript_30955:1-291(+)